MKKIIFYTVVVIVAVVGLFAALRTRGPVQNTRQINDHEILIAYFSATGNTKFVAEKLTIAQDAVLFQIRPAEPYTVEDLDWRNDKSRAAIEMADKDSRPEIRSKLSDISQYKTIFVGFPIWWGREPSIIDTFMESYDFSGKTIIPFATSGSSDIGDCAEHLQALAPKAKVLKGKRFPVDVSIEELKAWADKQK
ncbi:MAG: flavodoxin [Alphaproteobacteria bacterium]|nr:flavodoxin [Alphaproteobacteria bacterium]